MMKTIGLGLVLLLGGCAGLQSPDPASPYYAYAPGWTVQLNRPLTIPPDAATVRLQYGRIVPRNSVQEYAPFCVVELNTVRAEAQTLQPGRFEVWRVTRSVSPVAATASPFVKAGFVADDGDPTFLYFKTEFRLRDTAQPNLRGMSCAWNQMAPGNRALMRHLTLDEIRQALGGWMSLIPPGERP
ncbi:hypothetical protein [Thiobacillus sp. 65-1402]|uniref:hypothetical protein n=1 Tax=Thiobacillus sp. 65-1402 TaxID=1895861 RepID=UPI000ADEC650|nr:hypothetical protein [Thiobacillus sp. 65-1402]